MGNMKISSFFSRQLRSSPPLNLKQFLFKKCVLQYLFRGVFPPGTVFDHSFMKAYGTGKGKVVFPSGEIWEGSFSHCLPHGESRRLLQDKTLLEGRFVYGHLHGEGRIVFPDGQVCNTCFTQGHTENKITNDLFIRLLLGDDCGDSVPYVNPCAIISDYLEVLGCDYEAKALSSASLRDTNVCKNKVKDESLEVVERLSKLGEELLFIYGFKGHGMGLVLVQRVEGYIDCEIFNSGCGLDYHNAQGKKVETLLRVRVLKEEISEQKIREFMNWYAFENEHEAYGAILKIEGAKIIRPKAERAVFQTPQKGKNCKLEWIFAYLRNKMGFERYNKMRIKLFSDCISGLEKKSREEGSPLPVDTINELKRKIDKRVAKLAKFIAP